MKGEERMRFSRIRRFNAHKCDYGELYDTHTVTFRSLIPIYASGRRSPALSMEFDTFII